MARKRRSRLGARLPDGVWKCSAKLLAQAVLMPFSKLSSKNLPEKGFSHPFEVSNPKCRLFCAQNFICQAPALPSGGRSCSTLLEKAQKTQSICVRATVEGSVQVDLFLWLLPGLTGHLDPQTPLPLPTTYKTTCVVYKVQSKCHKLHNWKTKFFCSVAAVQTSWLWFGFSGFGNFLGLGVYPSCPVPGSPWGIVSARGPRCAPCSLHGGVEQCEDCEMQVSFAKFFWFLLGAVGLFLEKGASALCRA